MSRILLFTFAFMISYQAKSQVGYVNQVAAIQKIQKGKHNRYIVMPKGSKVGPSMKMGFDNIDVVLEDKKAVLVIDNAVQNTKRQPFYTPDGKYCVGFKDKFGNNFYWVSENGEHIANYTYLEKTNSYVLGAIYKSSYSPDVEKVKAAFKAHFDAILIHLKNTTANETAYQAAINQVFRIEEDLVAKAKAEELTKRSEEATKKYEVEQAAKRAEYLESNYVLNPRRTQPEEITRLKVYDTYDKTKCIVPYSRCLLRGGFYRGDEYVLYGKSHANPKRSAGLFFVNDIGIKDAYKLKFRAVGGFDGFVDVKETTNGDLVAGTYEHLYRDRGGKEGGTADLNLKGRVVTAVCDYNDAITVALASGTSTLSHKYTSGLHAARKALYLIIWNHRTNEHVEIPLLDDYVSVKPHILKTKDGNIVIAYNVINRSYSSYATHFQTHNFTTAPDVGYYPHSLKIDVEQSFKNKKLYSFWHHHSKRLRDAELCDLIEDRNGDLVAAYKGRAKEHPGNIRKEYHSAIYLEKISPKGKVISHYAFNHVKDNLFEGGASTPRPTNGEYIYMSWSCRPQMIQNPKGDGYIMVTRGAYDIVKYGSSSTYSQDFPLFIFFNQTTLSPESANFFDPTTKSYRHKNAMLDRDYPKRRNAMTGSFIIRDFSYDAKSDLLVLTEEGVSSNSADNVRAQKPLTVEPKDDKELIGRLYIWTIVYSLSKDKSRAAGAGNTIVAKTPSRSSSSNSNSSSSSNQEDSTPKEELVKVTINPNGKGSSMVKIFWKENGSTKKFSMNNRTTSVIGKIPVGTELSYSTELDDSNKTYFYTVPSGKSEVTVKL